jgi:hypothetical protein
MWQGEKPNDKRASRSIEAFEDQSKEAPPSSRIMALA